MRVTIDTKDPVVPEPCRLSNADHVIRVLVVDDNTLNQTVAGLLLESLGCSVDVAGDGREALAMTAAASYDIVFMDIMMPVMDGLEATEAIRRREKPEEHLRIVAVTAMEDAREKCLAAGMDDHLSKPTGRREYARMLSRWTGSSADLARGVLSAA